ncbi:hypothetical protein Y032_0397g688 [Ancylostoma ceylanicum]|uniref:Uncharacterized protein n=1 Tax=Ancylostoma ceylanicum TaxID=53326 RepID=A0A016RRD3_9BILA|nr:hypothetical protein Y032_0397g688 [Ancylostoma ceylanicum]
MPWRPLYWMPPPPPPPVPCPVPYPPFVPAPFVDSHGAYGCPMPLQNCVLPVAMASPFASFPLRQRGMRNVPVTRIFRKKERMKWVFLLYYFYSVFILPFRFFPGLRMCLVS